MSSRRRFASTPSAQREAAPPPWCRARPAARPRGGPSIDIVVVVVIVIVVVVIVVVIVIVIVIVVGSNSNSNSNSSSSSILLE